MFNLKQETKPMATTTNSDKFQKEGSSMIQTKVNPMRKFHGVKSAFRKIFVAILVALVGGLFVVQGPITSQASPTAKPDLKITHFGLISWGTCSPGNAVFTFQVTVANAGTAPSPAIPGMALVQARDMHGNGWGNGAVLPAIPAGGAVTVTIPVYYLMADAAHMTETSPHPFQAVVDPLGLVDELNEANNFSGVINVDLTGLCQPRKPDLKIAFFGVKSWGPCMPGSAVITFEVTVTNVGTAPSPAIPGMALVQVKDTHEGINWGNGAVLPSIPAGGSATVTIPVYYLAADPSHMTGAAPHPFQAIADPLGLVDELNEGNNLSGVINVGSPC